MSQPDAPELAPAPAGKPPLGFGDTVGEGFGLGCALLLVVGVVGGTVFAFAAMYDASAVGAVLGGLLIPAAVITPVVLWARRRGWFRLAQGLIVAAVIGVALMDAVIGGCWSIISS